MLIEFMKIRLKRILVLTLIMSSFSFLTYAQTAKDMPKDADTKKFIEMIAGTWKLKSIVDSEAKNKGKKTNQNPTDQGNNAMQMLEFQPNARYKMNSSTNAVDSGSYRLNEQHAILYMESDATESPTEWAISLNKNQLTLGGRGEEAEKRYKYIYVKTKDGVGTN